MPSDIETQYIFTLIDSLCAHIDSELHIYSARIEQLEIDLSEARDRERQLLSAIIDNQRIVGGIMTQIKSIIETHKTIPK